MLNPLEQTQRHPPINSHDDTRAAFSNEAVQLQADGAKAPKKNGESTHLDFGPISQSEPALSTKSSMDKAAEEPSLLMSVTDQQQCTTADVFAVSKKDPLTFISIVDAYNKDPQMMINFDQNGVLSYNAHVIVSAERVPGETAIINSIRQNVGKTL